jgi:hypothetical protein
MAKATTIKVKLVSRRHRILLRDAQELSTMTTSW